jgi:hypothetical protein
MATLDVESIEGIESVREGIDRAVRVSNHNQNLSAQTVLVQLFDDGQATTVGQGVGSEKDKPFIINATFDVEPGLYELEILVQGGDIVYPRDSARPRVEVVDSRYNN